MHTDNVRSSITVHVATYTLTDGRVRPVELAVVRRQTRKGSGWRTTRTRVVDAGAATRHAARQVAVHFSGGAAVETCEVDHGSLGTFGMGDADRDAMLAAVRALPLRIGGGNAHHVDPVQNSAVHGDRPTG